MKKFTKEKLEQFGIFCEYALSTEKKEVFFIESLSKIICIEKKDFYYLSDFFEKIDQNAFEAGFNEGKKDITNNIKHFLEIE